MPTFTYKIQEGVFVTTDLEPENWLEKFEVTNEQEQLIIDGAMLKVEDGDLVIINDEEIIVVENN
jgi:hypothetical protein